MKTKRPTKTEIKALDRRIQALTAERDSEYTRKLAPAAVRSVAQSLEAALVLRARMGL